MVFGIVRYKVAVSGNGIGTGVVVILFQERVPPIRRHEDMHYIGGAEGLVVIAFFERLSLYACPNGIAA